MRLFLALELPAPLGRAVAAVAEALRGSEPGWRWVRAEGIHVTLRFLGEVAGERVPELCARFAAVAAAVPPPTVEVGGLSAFPPRGRPRVLWIGVRGDLAPLAGALEGEARAAGFAAEERPFSAHLTLARAAADGRPRRPQAEVPVLGSFRAEEVTLFRSAPGRGGAAYTALARWSIGPALGWTP